jgi:hypothetical protein
MRYEFQPIGNWTDPVTDDRPICRFRASWPDTLALLDRETEKLGAQLVVVQVDVARGAIRRDGMLRADARAYFPGVRISFDSRFGPLTYATDQFNDWKDNVRAIALALEALRAVDRYGVNRRGEQYTGWLQIEAGPNLDAEAARALLDGYGGERAALRATHPDTVEPGTYDEAKFRAVQAARQLLAGAS